jgi:ring-1,2-phenylacetyl-CoA epoxidase subunit PaaE
MSVQFYPAKVVGKQQITADAVVITLAIAEVHQAHFAFKAGQYLTFKAIINGSEVRRSYSICSTPQSGLLQVGVKKVPEGIFSTYVNEVLEVGSTLEIMPPMGKFTYTPAANDYQHYVGFAAGSGITPMLSIIGTVLEAAPKASFTLVYGNKNRHSIMFKEALEALKNKYMQRFTLIHILSREITDATINHGRIDAAKCEQLFNTVLTTPAAAYYLCGPKNMILDITAYLEQRGINKNQIHFELFTSAASQKRQQQQTTATSDGPLSEVTVMQDGRTFTFSLAQNTNTILDAALAQGADLPFACKGGVCCTCKAKLISGNVTMEVNYGLEPDEVAAGYILTCQAHPTTATVVVDYDV